MLSVNNILLRSPLIGLLITLHMILHSQSYTQGEERATIELNSEVTVHNGTSVSPGSSSLTINSPAVAVGGVLVAQITVADNFRSRDIICTPPGWVSLFRNDFEGKVVQQIFYYIAESGQPAQSYTWHFKSNASACGSNGAVLSGIGATGGLLYYTGVDPLDPIDAVAGSVAQSSGTTATAPSVITTENGAEVIRFFSAFKDLTFTTTDSRIYTLGSSNNSAERTAAAYHAQQSTAGITPAFSATLSSSAEWVSATVALRPGPIPIKLAFQVQPAHTEAGDIISPPIEVSVLDDNNSLVTDFNGQISIALASNPGNGELSGTLRKNAERGVVIFDDLSINAPGEGYTLQATVSTFTTATSNPFNIITSSTGPPPAPVLLEPADGSSALNTTVHFLWKGVERADSYRIQVYREKSKDPVYDAGTTDTSYTVSGLEHTTTYSWRVNAINSGGSGSWSPQWSFTTAPFASHSISLREGWNMISSYIDPDNKSIPDLFKDIKDNVAIVKDGLGNLYIPEYNINDIGSWKYPNGYLVYIISHQDNLLLNGRALSPESTPISLMEGWNLVSYLGQASSNAISEFESIENDLIIVKNGDGDVYIPAGVIGSDPINTIGSLTPGEGYQVYINADADLIYKGGNTPVAKLADTFSAIHTSGPTAAVYPSVQPTDNNTILIIDVPDVQDGDEIGVWNESGSLIGSGFVQKGLAIITVWGAQSSSHGAAPGAMPDDRMRITLWNYERGGEFDLPVVSVYDIIQSTHIGNELTYVPDAVWHIETEYIPEVAAGFVLFQNYPNPFNPATVIGYRLIVNGYVTLTVYDILGREVVTLVDEEQSPGIYEVEFNVGAYRRFVPASSVYFYHLKAGNYTATKKMIVLK
jgi:hypothetical protein